MPSSPLLTRRAKHSPRGRRHIVSRHVEVASRSGPPAHLPLRVFTESLRPAPTFPRRLSSGQQPVPRIASHLALLLPIISFARWTIGFGCHSAPGSGHGGRATGLSPLFLLRLQHRRKSLLQRAVGRRFKSRGLTRRCSGLASLAAELHFVRRPSRSSIARSDRRPSHRARRRHS